MGTRCCNGMLWNEGMREHIELWTNLYSVILHGIYVGVENDKVAAMDMF